MKRVSLWMCISVALVLLVAPSAHAAFGFEPGTLKVRAENEDGTVDSQASSHPFAFNLSFSVNTTSGGLIEGGSVRDVIVDLPPGMFANPLALPACPRQKFEGALPACPPSTQVGVARANIPGASEAIGAVFNLQPPPGLPVQLGVSLAEQSVFLGGSLLNETGYRAQVAALNIPIEATGISTTIWGLPALPAHDSERGQKAAEGNGEPLPSEATPIPFLTLPASCGAAPEVRVRIDSKVTPGLFVEESAFLPEEGGLPAAPAGCESVPFDPAVKSASTQSSAESSSGLDFQLQLPNQGLLSSKEGAVTETEPEEMEVALPQGITANPAAAQGLSGCSPSQIGLKTAVGQRPVRFDGSLPSCPESSKLGTLTAQTPLLEEGLEGSVYLATPHDNPFNSLLALYVVARAPERGVIIKLAANASIDPATGQITTTIDGMPPVPYSSVELRLREGPRAPLISPQTCGEYHTTARLYPFSAPGAPVERTPSFKITSGAGGDACATSEAGLPNSPSLSAGSTYTNAGSYSPFFFKLSREDGSQQFGAVVAEPPLGLTARLAGIPYCPEAGIVQAASRTAEGDGATELALPSCPAASQIGTVSASAGAGPSPYTTSGKVYLAGPYRGAPLSFEAIVPAIAGPFDLGVVTSRIAVYVNEETAEIIAHSDPLPSILHGIPLDLRSIEVKMDRSEFTLNPTSCEAAAVTGSLKSVTGSLSLLSERFAVGGCRGLEFAPQLKLQLSGATKRAGHPALKAVITFPHSREEAHATSIQVGLPGSLFLDQGNLSKVCKQAELHAGTCPKGSIYGHVKAWTPLLEAPLEGPVYLGVGYGYKLPALVTDLNGQIRILAHGRTDTTKQHGLRNTFEFVPDAPLNRVVLELKGGKRYGLIENSENLCTKAQTANARLVAHNGRVAQLHPEIAVQCKQKTKNHRNHTSG
jgi:hypothetical protein